MTDSWKEKMRESGRGREMREKSAKCERNARSESHRTTRTRSQNGLTEAAGGGGGWGTVRPPPPQRVGRLSYSASKKGEGIRIGNKIIFPIKNNYAYHVGAGTAGPRL